MKTLTVQQKNYLVRRIESITANKLKEIDGEYQGKLNWRSDSSTGLDLNAAKALLEGKIPFKSHEDLLKILAKKVESQEESIAAAEAARAARRYYSGSWSRNITFSTFDVVEKKHVKKYSDKHNASVKKLDNEKKARRDAVVAEATKVKDKVILEGSEAAVALLEKFDKKKF